MKKVLLIGLFLVSSAGTYAQTQLMTDLDHDHVQDSVCYNGEEGKLTVKLSSRDFQSISGYPFPAQMHQWAEDQSISQKENGFSVEMDFLGANLLTRNEILFIYDEKEQKIRLKQMRITSSGSGNNVDARVNMNTNAFQAQWVLYDRYDQTREALPIVKTRMDFPEISLEGYDGWAFKKFQDAVDSSFERASEENEKKK